MTPQVDIVIIGLNSATSLKACIQSVKTSHYPASHKTLFYVDGGSTDNSVDIAKAENVNVIIENYFPPTAGRQRNTGWKAGTSEFIQFLDSDTQMDSNWLTEAIKHFENNVGAVSGTLRELYPEKSFYNRIGDLEWNPNIGEALFFGGNVLIRRSALESVNGFNPDLIAGEDPELAYRIRNRNFKIFQINNAMATHDLNMMKFAQYWKRSFRTGYAFREVHTMYSDCWKKENQRITLRGGSLFIAIICAILAPVFQPVILLSVSFILLVFFLRPILFLVPKFKKTLSLSTLEARKYAWNACFVVIPQFLGSLRYVLGRLFRYPLTNKKLLKVQGKVNA